MKVGTKLLLSSGECATIEAIQVEQLSQPETTYNFEVEDYHTYYVTKSKVLVHNSCRGTQRKNYWKKRAEDADALEKYGKDNLNLMRKGKSPIIEGEKIELHHVEGFKNNSDWIVEVTRSNHIAYHKQYGYKTFKELIINTDIPIFYGG